MELCSIGNLAQVLGVCVATLRRWERSGKLKPCLRTLGGHRRYRLLDAQRTLGIEPRKGLTLAYARVSSHDQKPHLVTQAARLRNCCQEQGWDGIEVLEDLGSGLNYRKKGLNRLIQLVLTGQVSRLVVVSKDRLLRFGAELLFSICKAHRVEVVVLDADPNTGFTQQLTEDLVEILTVFSSRLYGSRSRKNLRAIAG